MPKKISKMPEHLRANSRAVSSDSKFVYSVAQFLERVNECTKWWFDDDDEWGPWFRGEQKAFWSLTPKLYRDYGGFANVRSENIEDEIREEFIVRAPVLSETKPANNNEWEWYFLMQHFGAPTRLLDWTEGALIALYFAVKDSRGLHDAAVWALDPYELNKRAIGKEEIIPPSAGVTEKDAKLVKPWLPDRFTKMRRLPLRPVAVYPTHIARRISTQQSCFTVHGRDPYGLEKLPRGSRGCLEKIIIPSFSAEAIRRELQNCGIDEVTIFPDLDGLSRSLRLRWLPQTKSMPHDGVVTRLRPSQIDKGGIGVFAIVDIKKGTPLFGGDNDEMLWVPKKSVAGIPQALRQLYDDFAVIKDGRYGCPPNFNRLTMAWYLNEPNKGRKPNVKCDPKTYDFSALRDIKAGEELTVDYGEYSEYPDGSPDHA